MNALALAPVVPLVTGAACAVIPNVTIRRILTAAGILTTGAVGVAALIATQGGEVLVSRVGGFPAPFAITLVADAFAALMLVVFAVVSGTSLVFAAVKGEDEAPRYHAAALALVAAAAGATLTADLFNLFVWIEVLLLASYVLLTLGATPARVRAGTIYVATNFLGSTAFLAGVALVYATAGTVNIGELRGAGLDSGAIAIGTTLILIALGVKAAVVPVHSWLPRSYPVATPGVAALFSGTLTKVGIVALYRIVWVVFDGGAPLRTPLLVLAVVTMVVGVLAALGRSSMRGILASHMVSQIGYLLLALGIGTQAAIAAGIFFLAQYIGVKAGLFLVAGAVEAESGTDDLDRVGGIARRRPWLAAAFLVVALSLAGLPPLSGFVAKFALIRAAFLDGTYWLGAAAISVSLLTLLSMIKIWNGAFWGSGRERVESADGAWSLAAPAMFLAVVTIALGVGAEGLWAITDRAARALTDVAAYSGAVAP
jgi:multicomponent Na+:H+ antiporter subunit D